MTRSYEDIDEALAELDDESDDEGLFSRRRRRGRRAYVPQVIGGGNVSERRFATTIEKVGSEVATLENNTAAAVKKVQADLQNFAMMSTLMPLLLAGRTANVTDTSNNVVKVAVQGDSTLNLMLPLILMTQMTSGTATNQQGMANNSMMMMMMMVVLLQRGGQTP